jgi:hypothetical protein
LVADGRKQYETRSWSTRGPAGHDAWRPFPLAIHAGKGWTADDREFARSLGYNPATMIRGAVIAVCVVESCWSTDCYTFNPEEYRRDPSHLTLLDVEEGYVGDFGRGRFAWKLMEVQRITPVPAVGSLGLWEW